jgi:cell division protein FtsL
MIRSASLSRVLIILAVITLLSSLAVIYSKYYARQIFLDIQQQEKALEQYEVQWGQMQVELTMLTDQNRVEAIAREHLKLQVPARETIIYLKPPAK